MKPLHIGTIEADPLQAAQKHIDTLSEQMYNTYTDTLSISGMSQKERCVFTPTSDHKCILIRMLSKNKKQGGNLNG